MMEKMIVNLIVSFCFFQNLFACTEKIGFGENKVVPTRLAATALLNKNLYDEFLKLREIRKDSCGVCGANHPVPTETWSHPFGDKAHADCLKMIKEVENSTMSYFSYRTNFNDYKVIHQVAVWFVMKLCLPKTIAEYQCAKNKKELTRFFKVAYDLGMTRYQDYSNSLGQIDQNFADEIRADHEKFLAGLILGQECFTQTSV